MAKPKSKEKQIKRLRKQLYSCADQPSTRPGRFNIDENGVKIPVEDNGTIILTRKGRIMNALQILQNAGKHKKR